MNEAAKIVIVSLLGGLLLTGLSGLHNRFSDSQFCSNNPGADCSISGLHLYERGLPFIYDSQVDDYTTKQDIHPLQLIVDIAFWSVCTGGLIVGIKTGTQGGRA
jgi:hypothetical protein